MMKENQELSRSMREFTLNENLWIDNFKKGHETPTTPSTTVLSDDFKKTLDWGSRIIDIGCGWGSKIVDCADTVRGIGGVGIDINEKEIEWANKNWAIDGISFAKMDAADIKFSDNSFTHAIASGVLGAVGLNIRKKIIEEAFRVLRPGGILATSDFKYDNSDSYKLLKYEEDRRILGEIGEVGDRIVYNPKHERLFIVKHFTEEELRKLFLDSGFERLHMRENIIETQGFEDGKLTMRPQYTVLAQKPLKLMRDETMTH